jgi:hypothetical protein
MMSFWQKLLGKTPQDTPNLRELRKRLDEDRAFARVTVSRKGKNLKSWLPVLSPAERREGLRFARHLLRQSASAIGQPTSQPTSVYGQSAWIPKTEFDDVNTIHMLQSLVDTDARETIRLQRRSVISITIHGYDSDPRELYEVSDVCAWARKVHEAIPGFHYWLTVDSGWRFAGWLCGPVAKSEVQKPTFQTRLEEMRTRLIVDGIVLGEAKLRELGAGDGLIAKIRAEDLRRQEHQQEVPERPPAA